MLLTQTSRISSEAFPLANQESFKASNIRWWNPSCSRLVRMLRQPFFFNSEDQVSVVAVGGRQSKWYAARSYTSGITTPPIVTYSFAFNHSKWAKAKRLQLHHRCSRHRSRPRTLPLHTAPNSGMSGRPSTRRT